MKKNGENEGPRPVLTIVGGQPRELVGAQVGARGKFTQRMRVPVGLEKLLFLAARDPAIRERLVADRAGTAEALGVRLRPSETAMLAAAPAAVLETMIASIRPENPRKRKFMKLVAAAATSLAAGTALPACDDVEHETEWVMDAGGEGPDIDTDADTEADTDADAGTDTETGADADTDSDAGADAGAVDTDTYAGGGIRSDLSEE